MSSATAAMAIADQRPEPVTADWGNREGMSSTQGPGVQTTTSSEFPYGVRISDFMQ